MGADNARFIAQLVIGRRVHCVGDEAVMALAKRVLELEAECAAKHAAAAKEATRRARAEADVADEREACALVALQHADEFGSHAGDIADAIRARGSK